MTLRKQNTKHTTRQKLTRAVKPLFKPKPAKADKVEKTVEAATPTASTSAPEIVKPALPAAAPSAMPKPAHRVTVSSIAREAKKASRSLDGIAPGKPLPSASTRPIITTSTPTQVDNTLAPAGAPSVIDVSRPAGNPTMVHKRTMVSQPPAAMSASDTLQSNADAPEDDAKAGMSIKVAERDITAPQVAGRPAKPLLSKPVAAGPTVAELLSKQHEATSDDDSQAGLESEVESETDASPVTVTAAPTATVATSIKVDDVKPPKPETELATDAPEEPAAEAEPEADDASEDAKADKQPASTEPVNPKPQLVTLAKSASATPEAPAAKPAEANETEAATDAPSSDTAADDKPAEADVDVAGASTEEKTESDEMGSLQGDVKTEKAEPTPPPKAELYGGRPVIIIHESHPVREFVKGLFVFIVGLVVLAAAVNFLLDADIIHTGYNIPHTNLLDPK